MKEIPESQRPYEKCIREGESTLSDGELLAVILRCEQLLAVYLTMQFTAYKSAICRFLQFHRNVLK